MVQVAVKNKGAVTEPNGKECQAGREGNVFSGNSKPHSHVPVWHVIMELLCS
jgi:hypothetical protein